MSALEEIRLSRWRCMVKPRMVIRSEQSTASQPHEKWPKGLSHDEEVVGHEHNGWVHIKGGGYGLISHPSLGLLLKQVKDSDKEVDDGKGHAQPDQYLPDVRFTLDLDALQGRWRHSVAQMGLLTVKGPSVEFDSGKELYVHEEPGDILIMAGWRASVERSSAKRIVWVKDGPAGEVSCNWIRAHIIPVVFWGICDIKYDPELPPKERVRVLELGDGRASRFSNHGAAIKETFDSKYCMDSAPIKRAVLVDNKKLTHDIFVHSGFAHLRPLTFTYPRRYFKGLARQVCTDLQLGTKGAAVLKLCNRSRGAGVVVASVQAMDTVLERLLSPPAGEALARWLEDRRGNAVRNNTTFPDLLEEQSLHWWSNECPVFVAERCCRSTLVSAPTADLAEHEEESSMQRGLQKRSAAARATAFDGTLRVAFALHRAQEAEGDTPLQIDWLGGYWKLPPVASTAEDSALSLEELHDRVVSSFSAAEKRTAAADAAHLREVYKALTPALPLIFDAGELRPDLINSIYEDEPLFRAFALCRAAAAIRIQDRAGARELLEAARESVAETAEITPQGRDSGCILQLPERSVLSYVERNAGVAFALESDWAKAGAHWKKALDICPVNSTAHYLEGCYHQVIGEYEQGIQSIQTAIALDPDFRSSYIGLGECYLFSGNFESAVEAGLGCLRRFPEASGAQFVIGQAIYHLFRKEENLGGDSVANFTSDMAIRALETVKKCEIKRWNIHDEEMLNYFKSAAGYPRQKFPKQAVRVWKVYGWRP